MRNLHHKSLVKLSRGFTLIELIVVFSIIGTIAYVGIASFVTFNNNAAVEGATIDVQNAYIVARQRSLSQIKPPSCAANQALRGYTVTISTTNRTYQVSALCGTSNVQILNKTLPPNVNFNAGSTTSVFFSVPNGLVNTPGIVTINGYGKTKTIRIEGTGAISVT